MKKIIALVAILAVSASSIFVFASNSTKISASKKALAEKQQVISDIKQQANQKRQYKNELLNQIGNLEDKVNSLESDIDSLNSRISQTQSNIARTSSEIDKTKEELDLKNDLLGKRVRTMYKEGNVGYIEVVLGSKDFTDFMTRMDMVQRIYSHDKELIEEINQEKKELEAKKVKLVEHKDSLQAMSAEVVAKKSDLDSSIIKLDEQKEIVSKDLNALIEREEAMAREADALKSLISRLQNPSKNYTKGPMQWPVPSTHRISATYGYSNSYFPGVFHRGIDIAAPYGSTIVAAKDGEVVYAGWQGTYGKCVMIDHGGGVLTVYAHTSSILAGNGQKVERGQAIARVGSTGNSTGNHLHFEVRVGGELQNPLKWVN